MPYASLQDAINLYGETYVLTSVDRDGSGEADETAINAALNQASSEMDSYIAAKYTLPIPVGVPPSPPVPTVMIRYCVDIAIYQMSQDAGTYTDEKRKRYEDAIKWLMNVAKGYAHLPIDPIALDTSSDAPSITGNHRQMSRRSLRGVIC